MCQTLSDVSWLKTSILQSDAVFPARDAVKAIPCALRGAVISFYWKDKWTCSVRGNWIAPVRRARVRKRPAAARNMQSAALPILHFICLIDAPRVAGLYLETGFFFFWYRAVRSQSRTLSGWLKFHGSGCGEPSYDSRHVPCCFRWQGGWEVERVSENESWLTMDSRHVTDQCYIWNPDFLTCHIHKYISLILRFLFHHQTHQLQS